MTVARCGYLFRHQATDLYRFLRLRFFWAAVKPPPTLAPYFFDHLLAILGCLAYMKRRCLALRKGIAPPVSRKWLSSYSGTKVTDYITLKKVASSEAEKTPRNVHLRLKPGNAEEDYDGD